MKNYEETKSKIDYIFDKLQKNELDLNKLKDYRITYSVASYIYTKTKYDILIDYDFWWNYDNTFIIKLEQFPEDFLPFLKVIPIFKVFSPYKDFLTYNEFRIMDFEGTLPEHYYYLTQKCLWYIRKIEESDIIKYYLVGYIMGELMDENFGYFPLKGDLYIHADMIGDRK